MRSSRPRSFAHARPNPLLVVAAAAAVAATFAAAHAHAATHATRVTLHTTSVGRILTDAQGRSLYMFAIDKHDKSACYGACAQFWPPLLASGKPAAGSGVKASLLGTTMRRDGKLQVTYAGHPLYHFVKDTKPGETAGQGLNASGGLWWALTASGSLDRKKTTAAAPTSTSSTTSSGSGSTTTGGSGGYGG